jgi:hypothetical protein
MNCFRLVFSTCNDVPRCHAVRPALACARQLSAMLSYESKYTSKINALFRLYCTNSTRVGSEIAQAWQLAQHVSPVRPTRCMTNGLQAQAGQLSRRFSILSRSSHGLPAIYRQGPPKHCQPSALQSRGFQSSSRLQHFQMQNVGSLDLMPPEYIVYGILGLNLGVFALWQVEGLKTLMRLHFSTSYNHLRLGYLHTLLTSGVSHQNLSHLFSNMFTFYFFGTSLAYSLGGTKVRDTQCPPHHVLRHGCIAGSQVPSMNGAHPGMTT